MTSFSAAGNTSLSLDAVEISSERRVPSLEGGKVVDTLRQLAKIRVRGLGGEVLRADTLWQRRPVLLLLLRRPGCGECQDRQPLSEHANTVPRVSFSSAAVTCRAESLKLEQIADRLDHLGIRRVAIVHEWVSNRMQRLLHAA